MATDLYTVEIQAKSTGIAAATAQMESLGKHDDMVIALALAVQATKEYRESIVILDGPTWQKRLGWADA